MDKYFQVKVISQTSNPQQVIYSAAHQDYSEEFVWNDLQIEDGQINKSRSNKDEQSNEAHYGELIVKHLLAGNRGHFGCLEHPQIVLNCGWFPHSTMQQIRTHRVGISFDCQSFRYSGTRILDVVEGKRGIEEVFYLRPLGTYSDRQGKHYEYTTELRQQDLDWCLAACHRYKERIEQGFSEEHARGLIPFDVRQHWVMSANVRSLMHLLDLRWKTDAQLECQQLCDLIWPHFETWVPQIAEWYLKNRAKKARLAP
jgi:thymidylate synthase (FAD)